MKTNTNRGCIHCQERQADRWYKSGYGPMKPLWAQCIDSTANISKRVSSSDLAVRYLQLHYRCHPLQNPNLHLMLGCKGGKQRMEAGY